MSEFSELSERDNEMVSEMVEAITEATGALIDFGQAEERTLEILNDCNEPFKIGNLTYPAGDTFRDIDPVAFRCAVNDIFGRGLKLVIPWLTKRPEGWSFEFLVDDSIQELAEEKQDEIEQRLLEIALESDNLEIESNVRLYLFHVDDDGEMIEDDDDNDAPLNAFSLCTGAPCYDYDLRGECVAMTLFPWSNATSEALDAIETEGLELTPRCKADIEETMAALDLDELWPMRPRLEID